MPDDLVASDDDADRDGRPRVGPEGPPPEMIQGLLQAVIQEVRVAPMPDMDYINAMAVHVPDAAERFLRVYEAVGSTRHAREMARIDGQLLITKRGQLIGGGLVALIVVLGAALQVMGTPNAWVTAVSITTLGIAAAFVGGKYLEQQRKSNGEKTE